MKHEDLSKFTHEELNSFKQIQLAMNKLDLLESYCSDTENFPQDIANKLYEMCSDILKKYNCTSSILSKYDSKKDWYYIVKQIGNMAENFHNYVKSKSDVITFWASIATLINFFIDLCKLGN